MITQLSPEQLQQYIDAVAVFEAHEASEKEVRQYRGSMFWKTTDGRRYLVRASALGAQKSLGPESEETVRIFDKFSTGKAAAQDRHKELTNTLAMMSRLNKALRVGRMPEIPTQVLNKLARAGVASSFTTVGTYALYAYEAALGIRVSPRALATRDVDLLFDVQTHMKLVTQLNRIDRSFIGLLREVDKSFRPKPGQLYTAVNARGFEVDVVRRNAIPGDAHPLRLTDDEDDLWAVQVSTGQALSTSPKFSQVVVSTTGSMARMNTVTPDAFVRVKLALSQSKERDPKKAVKDADQAAIVSDLLAQGMFEFLTLEPAEDMPSTERPH